jgi:hypothetical protein
MDLITRMKLGVAAVGLTALLSGGCSEPARGTPEKPVVKYVMIRQSGGVITDVYKIRDPTRLNSYSDQTPWGFKDYENNSYLYLSGDLKVIRFDDSNNTLADQYCEYHQEFAGGKTYFEMCPPKTK